MKLRIATFNLENLDDKPGQKPTLEERIAVIRPQLFRLNADILCLQEVNGQEETGHPRRLLALDVLLRETPYAGFHRVSTMTGDGSQVCNERNLVILSRYEIQEHHQYRHYYAPAPHYRIVTAERAEGEEQKTITVTWERPILHSRISIEDRVLDVINLHLKSRLPSDIEGQKLDQYTWKTASGWAEGFFISSMKRVGQALETRMLIDKLFDADENAWIVVCGDFNADFDEVPVEAIRGEVENTGNGGLARRVMLPCEMSIPESARFSLYHRGRGRMLDHLLVSRSMLAHYKGSEVHNELLHDESVAFATEAKFPESDHAPVVAEFELPDNG
ncbi:endonuclease [Methanosarcina sp. 1.H.T.1A.1]|uniref:endonuclease/exonuclease/phosphatase family protein n=1 Tax=Methanosarcina sp. 1.H.T.1A.1 TaxID=1483602 RepID=UPI000621335A|nr:endonuclease/exonuclease/phosphatase family protein [Methanosarcina sp. 1.H.T.1A.1]KKH95438.1 endonuclease [Methanosarcina sp. 1.H.T.1A.1]